MKDVKTDDEISKDTLIRALQKAHERIDKLAREVEDLRALLWADK